MAVMRIGILGSGTMARALGGVWSSAGHEVTIGGRSAERTQRAAAAANATAAAPAAAVHGRDAVLLAVLWEGVEDMLRLVDAGSGTLADMTLIDPTNAVEHGAGVLLTEGSAAERIAGLAPGANVVKAFHLFPVTRWSARGQRHDVSTVAICGDDPRALDVTGQLVRDAGGVPAVLGGLDRARQLEEVAGFTIGLASSGVSPATALPAGPG